jgi:hypothetical protein
MSQHGDYSYVIMLRFISLDIDVHVDERFFIFMTLCQVFTPQSSPSGIIPFPLYVYRIFTKITDTWVHRQHV